MSLLTIGVLCSQIFVPQQQFLIDGAGDVGQHASPNHFVPLWLIELGESWIVGLVEAVKKAIRRELVEAASLAFSNRSSFLTLRDIRGQRTEWASLRNPELSSGLDDLLHQMQDLRVLDPLRYFA